jgi:hypothetical protein
MKSFSESCQWIGPNAPNGVYGIHCNNESEFFYLFPSALACRCKEHPLRRDLYSGYLVSKDEAKALEVVES